MTSYGIAILCYVALTGEAGPSWQPGREVRAGGHHRLLFVPDAPDAPAMWVYANQCKYIEDPVKAESRMLAQQAIMQEESEANRRELAAAVERLTEGSERWCLLNGYGARLCKFKMFENCLKAMRVKPRQDAYFCAENPLWQGGAK